jgi:hypothetical protein
MDAAERGFYEREAQNAASTLSLMVALTLVAAVVMTRDVLSRPVRSSFGVLGLLALGGFWLLFAKRHRPSERFGIAVALFATLPAALIPLATQPELIRGGRAFEPLLSLKVLALLLPLAVGRRLWLGVVLEAALVAQAAWFFYERGLAAVRDRIPAYEPWLTYAYALIGVGLLLASEYRRVASVQAMRADRELSTQAHRAGLQIAVLDQLGSPLQTLFVHLDTLRALAADREQTQAVADALRVLATLRDRVPALDERATALVRHSFNSEALLRRSH